MCVCIYIYFSHSVHIFLTSPILPLKDKMELSSEKKAEEVVGCPPLSMRQLALWRPLSHVRLVDKTPLSPSPSLSLPLSSVYRCTQDVHLQRLLMPRPRAYHVTRMTCTRPWNLFLPHMFTFHNATSRETSENQTCRDIFFRFLSFLPISQM